MLLHTFSGWICAHIQKVVTSLLPVKNIDKVQFIYVIISYKYDYTIYWTNTTPVVTPIPSMYCMYMRQSRMWSMKQCCCYLLDEVVAVCLRLSVFLSVFDVVCHPATCRNAAFDVRLLSG